MAQSVISDLLSSPKSHQSKVDANIILDNFLLDLKQSLMKRYKTKPAMYIIRTLNFNVLEKLLNEPHFFNESNNKLIN